jgi:DNA polymerase
MTEDLRIRAARLIRQSMEMGEVEWFLDRYVRDEVLELVRDRAPGGATGAAGTSDTAPPVPREMLRPRSPADAPPADPPTPESLATARASVGPGHPISPATSTPTSAESPPHDVRKDLPVLPDDMDALREVALRCTRCGLAEGRTQVVFSDGVADARLMVVGEAPGANEDETGLPFVGAAGKFLDLLLQTVDLSREESVYICNVLKCRPPGNRNPEAGEIATCSPYLLKQIELVRPDAILAVGSFSGQLLTGQEKTALSKLRGRVHSYQGVPLVVTYHPAALLRNGNWTRSFWEDLQLLRDVLDGAYLDGPDVP